MTAGCGGSIESTRETAVAEMLGLGIEKPCKISRREGRRLAGVYARTTAPSGRTEPFFLSGTKSRTGLPRSLRFEKTTIRRLASRDKEHGLSGGYNSRLLIKDSFAQSGSPPSVFTLAYERKSINYVGTLVIGQSPSAQELNLARSSTFHGAVELHLMNSAEKGIAEGTGGPYKALFSLQTNIQTGRSTFLLTDIAESGAQRIGFSGLVWDQLYLCCARIASSGQGAIELRGEQQLKDDTSGPFEVAIAEDAIDAVFEAVQFAPAQRPGAPNRIGGVFLIYVKDLILKAVFLSDVLEG